MVRQAQVRILPAQPTTPRAVARSRCKTTESLRPVALLERLSAETRFDRCRVGGVAVYPLHSARLRPPTDNPEPLDCTDDAVVYARILHDLKAHLRAEKLVAWGRRESPMVPHAVIPASAWEDLNISSVSKSKLTEATRQKTPILDVRIFPVVKSPDAVESLAGRKLSEAIQLCVAEDPQIRMRFLRAISTIDDKARVRDHEPARMIWPVARDKEGSDGKAADLGASDNSTKYDRLMWSTNLLMNRRLEVLFGHLASGALAAEGLPMNSASAVPISRSIWCEPRTSVNLRNGDLHETDPREGEHAMALSKPIFTGLVLSKQSTVDRLRSADAGGHPASVARAGKAAERVITKVSAESACLGWLSDLMEANPTKKLHTKDEYWQQAQTKWSGRLARRGFERAWDNAVRATNAIEWSASGRPKSSQA